MSKSNVPNGGASSTPNVLPIVVSAVVIFVVLGLIFGLLLSRPSPQQRAQSEAQTQQVLQHAQETSVAQENGQATGVAQLAGTSAAQTGAQAGTPQAATEGSKDNRYPSPPPMTIDPAKNYTATITTPRGDIVIKLRPDLAPETVNSFVFLANQHFYDGLTWHRVIPNFMAQGGDPKGDGTGGPGYTVKGEFTEKVLFDKPGIVAMARPGNDVNGNGSQFFITTAAYPSLNNQYTVFGEVTKGQDIVDGIPTRDPSAATSPGEQIVKIAISEG